MYVCVWWRYVCVGIMVMCMMTLRCCHSEARIARAVLRKELFDFD